MKSTSAAKAFNKWWQKRTESDAIIATPTERSIEDGSVYVDAKALLILVEYARNMSVAAERRRERIATLSVANEKLQRALEES